MLAFYISHIFYSSQYGLQHPAITHSLVQTGKLLKYLRQHEVCSLALGMVCLCVRVRCVRVRVRCVRVHVCACACVRGGGFELCA